MTPEPVPLCGDPTCQSPGCQQAAIDAWYQRQWDEAGRIVWGLLGRDYPGTERNDR